MLLKGMKRSIVGGRLRKVLYVLLLSMSIIGVLPNQGAAAVIPADEADEASALKQENIATIQAMLERKEVEAMLEDYGLTSEEVGARLDELSDEQVAEIAAEIDKVNAGGDALSLLVTILILVLLVLLVLYLLGYWKPADVKMKNTGADTEEAPAI